MSLPRYVRLPVRLLGACGLSLVAQLCVTGVPGICGWTGGLAGSDWEGSALLNTAAFCWLMANLAGLVVTALWSLVAAVIGKLRPALLLTREARKL